MSCIAWIPKKDSAIYIDKAILSIQVCAYPATTIISDNENQDDNEQLTNHWFIVCNLTENTSIRFDPSPSGPSMSMVLIATHFVHKNSHIEDEAVKAVKLDVTGLTIKGFLNLLDSAKYDKYQFTESGQGCRYWLYSVIKLLLNNGSLKDENQASLAMEALERVWADDGELAPAKAQSGMRKGRFLEISDE